MSEYHTKRAAEILQAIQYATIATVTPDGKPWVSPVARVLDDELNIYWISDKDNQHSKNVRSNENVSIVVYDSTVPEGEGEGVYIEAVASELSDPQEILHVRTLKKGEDYQPEEGEFTAEAVRRVYKADVIRMFINDAEIQDGVFIRDYKVEVDKQDVIDFMNHG